MDWASMNPFILVMVKKEKTENSFQTDWWVLGLKDRGSSSKPLGRETQTNLPKQNPKIKKNKIKSPIF